MNSDFVAEILRTTGSLRAGDPSGATDIIQAALAAGGLSSPAGAPSPGKAGARTTRRPVDASYIEGTLVGDAPNDTIDAAAGTQAPAEPAAAQAARRGAPDADGGP